MNTALVWSVWTQPDALFLPLHFQVHHKDGSFIWTTAEQGYVLSSFFYGYVLTQIPFGILAKKYGAKYFLGEYKDSDKIRRVDNLREKEYRREKALN